MQDTLDGIEIEKEDTAEPPSPFSESAVPKKAKRSQKDKDSGETQYLMEMLQGTNEFISSVAKKGELDEDDLFGQSIAMELKTLSEYKKSLAKIKIQQAMHKMRFSPEPNLIKYSCAFHNTYFLNALIFQGLCLKVNSFI